MTRYRLRVALVALVALVVAAFATRADDAISLDHLRVTSVGPIGPRPMRVDLVILGDGYVKADFAPKGKWEIDTARLIKNFFEKEPFKTRRDLFNVYLVEVPSLDRGADDTPDSHVKRTAFGSCFGNNGIQRLLAMRDQDAFAKALTSAPACDMALLLVNDPRLGGSGGTSGNVPAPVCSNESTAFLTAIHELGHSFAGLTDEYADPEAARAYALPESGDIPFPNVQVASLVDTSSRDALVRTLKWGRYLRAPGAFDRLGKGFYEGGYYREKGVYRPAAKCVMADQYGSGAFCYVCLDLFMRAILRCCNRGPSGAFPSEPVDLAPGALPAASDLYEEARYAKLLSELKRVEGNSKASDVERAAAKALRDGIDASFDAGVKRLDDWAAAGDKGAVHEFLPLMKSAFQGIDRAKEIEAKEKGWTGR